MIRISPAIKVSLGLVLVTVTILLLADILGLVPDERHGLLEGRKKFAETLAIQTTLVASQENIQLVQITFDSLVSRNSDVLSAALYAADGTPTVISGEHALHWEGADDEKSTTTHVQIPMFRDNALSGKMQIVFEPLGTEKAFFGKIRPLHILVGIFSIFGFLAYLFYIKRMLRELDPGAVVPERVMSAFNTLAEGVLILDDHQQIVLANTAFTEKIGKPNQNFVGRKATSIGWDIDPDKSDAQLPWTECINNNERVIDQPLRFGSEHDKRVFMVNATPIGEAKGKAQGVLVTFDDITDLERKRQEQSQTLIRLEKSEQELQDRTIALEFLASRDPLTGCFNRRAFFENFDKAFADARNNGTPLGCLMVDVDKFKNVNDTYGHHVGDQVIKFVADTLRANSRNDDIVGRMGGEEFCMVLPGVESDVSVAIAERIRLAIQEAAPSSDVPELRITASFGVVQMDGEVADPADIVNRSDEGLYAAKETGRNKTVLWSKQIGEQRAEIAAEASAPSAEQPKAAPVVDIPVVQPAKAAESDNELDELTGLLNRSAFLREINAVAARARENDGIAAVVSVDINSFKRVNSALGHVVGDKLLRLVARDFGQGLDAIATPETSSWISRLANDEFGILLEGYSNVTDIKSALRIMMEQVIDRAEIEGHQIILNYSTGVSIFPTDADEPRALLQNASAARTESKRREGNNIIEFFSRDINRAYYKRLWLESQLHSAMENGEFSLHYQPKTDIKTGSIQCMEALIRWTHPRVGDISPNEFIPVAENTGFICTIGEWVLEEACLQGQKWREEGIRDLRVAVNLSNVQLRQPEIEKTIVQVLDRTGFSPSLLELEITETAFLNDYDHAVSMVRNLRERGVHFALDDFGTGYSSFNTLKELPFDSIKIDRSFIGETVPSGVDKEILAAIISIAHKLEIPVVAEGVETKAQLALLKTMGCDAVQGFMFGRPTIVKDATEVLQENQRARISNAA